MNRFLNHTKEFVKYHYILSERRDSEWWRYWTEQENNIQDFFERSLNNKRYCKQNDTLLNHYNIKYNMIIVSFRVFLCATIFRISRLTTLGKPPALPGDSQSLTFAGTKESLPPVNRSKFNRRKAQNERHWKATAFAMGMQVSHSVDSQVSAESSVWAITPRIR